MTRTHALTIHALGVVWFATTRCCCSAKGGSRGSDGGAEHHRKLWDNTEYFRSELQPWDLTQEFQLRQLFQLWRIQCSKRLTTELAKEGVMAGAIVFPMVARDKARIRTQRSGLTKDDWMSLSGYLRE